MDLELSARRHGTAKTSLPVDRLPRLIRDAIAAFVMVAASPYCTEQLACAQDTQQEPEEAVDRADQAREHFSRAKELYRADKRAAAILELQRAYDLRPSARILRTIAEIAEEMHDYAAALRAWRRYQSDMGDRLDASERLHVQARLSALEGFVAELRIEGGEPGAQVLVDDELIGTLPLAEHRLLNVGRHTVRVEKNGFVPLSRVITLVGGDPVRLVLERLGRTPPATPDRSAQPPQLPTVKPEGRATKWTWVGFGSAATLGAAGAITGVMALRADDKARGQTFAGSEPPAHITDGLQEARGLGIATDVLVGAAVTTALVTAYFTWIHPSDRATGGRDLRAGLGAGQAWVGGAF